MFFPDDPFAVGHAEVGVALRDVNTNVQVHESRTSYLRCREKKLGQLWQARGIALTGRNRGQATRCPTELKPPGQRGRSQPRGHNRVVNATVPKFVLYPSREKLTNCPICDQSISLSNGRLQRRLSTYLSRKLAI